MSGVVKSFFWLAVGAIAAVVGFVFAYDPGDSPATCSGETMQAGDICIVHSKDGTIRRTLDEQADFERRDRKLYGWLGGIVGSAVFLGAGVSLISAVRKLGPAADPDEGAPDGDGELDKDEGPGDDAEPAAR